MTDPEPSVCYDAGENSTMVFSRQCPMCGRFVKTPPTCIALGSGKTECIGTCSRCGDVNLDFIGYF